MNEPVGPLALILLVVPAFALRLAVRALYGRQRLPVADPMQTLLSLSSSILFALAGLGFFGGTLGLWFLFIPMPFVLAVVLLNLIDRTRHSEHRALVWSLAAAAEKGVPLSEAARAFSDEATGDTGLRALALAEALERGESLPQAIRTARLRMGTAMKLAVRLGERLGLLADALRQQLDGWNRLDASLQFVLGRFFYLGMVLCILSGILTFVMLRIVPVFYKMFEEFGLKLPAMTNLVVHASNWFVRIGWIFLLPILGIGMPLFFFIAVLYYVGFVPRNIPGWWLLFRRYDGALVMRGLALAIQRGYPLPAALHLISEEYPLTIVGGRLRRAAERIEAGQDWRQSLLQTGLIGPADAAVLGAAERVGNLPWALEEMADSAMRRQTYRVQFLQQFLFPLLLLVVGVLVFFFVAGMFMPLISLIQGLT